MTRLVVAFLVLLFLSPLTTLMGVAIVGGIIVGIFQ